MKGLNFRICLFFLLVSLQACGIFRKKAVQELSYDDRLKFEELYFKGATQKVLGHSEAAMEAFKDALEVNPSCHACMYQLANLNYARQNLTEAIYWAEASIKYNPSYNFWYYGQLGQFYNRSGNYTKSAEIFSRMMAFEPQKPSNYLEAANQYINSGEFRKSLEILEKYEVKFGIDEESARKMEGLWTQLDKPEKAVEVMERLVKANPENVRFMGLLAEAYLRNKRIADALSLYQSIIGLEPENGFAHFGIADIYRKSGDEEKSFRHLLLAFSDEEVSSSLKLQVVQSFLPFIASDSNMRKQSLTLLDALVTAHPTESNVYIAYSDVLYTSGEPERSRSQLKKGLEFDPSNYSAWLQLISLDSELDNFNFMVTDAEMFVDRFPLQAIPYLSYAHACMNLGNYRKAAEIASEGLEISRLKEDKVQFLITLASSHFELGAYDKSDAAHEELLKIAPEDALALNNYSYFLAERGERLKDALVMIDKALKQDSLNISYLDTKGWVLYKMGSFAESEIWLRKAAELDPEDPEILEHLMEALLRLERNEEAGVLKEKIKSLKVKSDS